MRSHEDQGVHRRSQEEPAGARRTQEEPRDQFSFIFARLPLVSDGPMVRDLCNLIKRKVSVCSWPVPWVPVGPWVLVGLAP